MIIVFGEKAIFFYQIGRFFRRLGTKICNIEIWSMRINQNLDSDFFAITRSNLFSCPFLFLSLALLLSLYFESHILSGSRNETSINYWYSGAFYHHFCSKTDNLLSSKADRCVDRSILALLNHIKNTGDILNWWRHKWYKEQDYSWRILLVFSVTPFKIDCNKNQNHSIDKVQNLGKGRK